jgi:hypothetical protein
MEIKTYYNVKCLVEEDFTNGKKKKKKVKGV